MTVLQEDDHVVLVIADETLFFDQQKALFAELRAFKKVCVYALIKPASIIDKQLRTEGFDDGQLYYIDAASGCKGVKQCGQVDSLQDLTSMSIEFTKAMTNQKCDAAMLSPLNIMFSYMPGASVIKFVSILAQKAREKDATLVLLTSWNAKDAGDLQDATLFMDRIVDLRKAA